MDAVEEVKSRLAIEDVIGEYLELKRSGRNFKGLSPFTSEKTPSFMVSPEKQIWHDFSSGKGGNMFSFVMEMEGLDFKAALELLARKAGLDLTQYGRGDAQRGKQKERLYEVLDLATKFYQVHFSKNQTALEYVFKTRQYTKQIALAFRLGYSPNSGSALQVFLRQKGFSTTEIKQAGLSNQRGGDMFRGRLMVPLMDPLGRVIGFTARLLEDDPKAPKYINTPQTLLYDKSRHIFGLNLAKEGIRKANFVVLVEGNLDVIAAHQAGTTQTVATAGTALTEYQLKGLRRFTDDVRLCFDEDQAGVAATERAIPIAAKVGVNLGIIKLPERAKDPDELIKQDAKKWQAVIEKPVYVLDWLIDQYQGRLDVTSAVGKRQFSDVLIKTIRQLPDSVEQDHYLSKIAELIGVSKSSLETKLRGTRAETQVRKHVQPPQTDRHAADHIKTQNHLLAICLLRPDLRHNLKHVTTDMIIDEPAQKLTSYLQAHPEYSGDIKTVPELKKYNDFAKMLALLFEELYQDLETLELRYEAARLQVRLITQYVSSQKQRLAAAMRQGSASEAENMLAQAKALDQLLMDATKEMMHAERQG
jgi:DNA primase